MYSIPIFRNILKAVVKSGNYVVSFNSHWTDFHKILYLGFLQRFVNIFIVVPCMLFQSLLYCSNSCTSLHFKTLTSHTKTLKILPCMFRSPLKPRYPPHTHTHTHTHARARNELTYSHMLTLFITNVNQHSNPVT